MKFIKDNHAHILHCVVLVQHTREDSFRNYFQTCIGTDAGIKSDAITHCLPQFLAKHVCHPLRNAFGSQAAGFEQQDFFSF